MRLVMLDGVAAEPVERPAGIIQTLAVRSGSLLQIRVSHEMTMVLAGTALIGAASLMRRAA